jgi:hypothetical protein
MWLEAAESLLTSLHSTALFRNSEAAPG